MYVFFSPFGTSSSIGRFVLCLYEGAVGVFLHATKLFCIQGTCKVLTIAIHNMHIYTMILGAEWICNVATSGDWQTITVTFTSWCLAAGPYVGQSNVSPDRSMAHLLIQAWFRCCAWVTAYLKSLLYNHSSSKAQWKTPGGGNTLNGDGEDNG